MKNNRLGNDPLSWIGKEPIKTSTETSTKEKTDKISIPSTKEAAKDEKVYVKKTADIREDLIEKIHDVAYWDRIKIRDAWERIIEFYFEQNKVKPRPKQD